MRACKWLVPLLLMSTAAVAQQVPRPLNAPQTSTAGHFLFVGSSGQQAADNNVGLGDGAGNLCTNAGACTISNKTMSATIFGGGTDPSGRATVWFNGTSNTNNAFVNSVIAITTTVAPTGAATAVADTQFIATFDGCANCSLDPTFGLSVFSGHAVIASTFARPGGVENLWDVNPAAVSNPGHIVIKNHVIYAGPGGKYCGQDGQTVDAICKGISIVGAQDSPGIGATFSYFNAEFGVPQVVPDAAFSHANVRALFIPQDCPVVTPITGQGTVDECHGIFESSNAPNQFRGDIVSNDPSGYALFGDLHCDTLVPVIEPGKGTPSSGIGCDGANNGRPNMIAHGVEDTFWDTAGEHETNSFFPVDGSVWNSGGVVVGASASQSIGGSRPLFEVLGTDTSAAIGVGRWSNDLGPPRLKLFKGCATVIGTHCLVTAGMSVVVDAEFDDGVANGGLNTGRLQFIATGTPASGSVPTAFMVFLNSSLTPAFGIDSAGTACANVTLGAAAATCTAGNRLWDINSKLYGTALAITGAVTLSGLPTSPGGKLPLCVDASTYAVLVGPC